MSGTQSLRKMYISYGWPKLLKAIDAGDDEVIVHISIQKFLVVVSTTCIQVWASGQVGPLLQLEEWGNGRPSLAPCCNFARREINEIFFQHRRKCCGELLARNVSHPFFSRSCTDSSLRGESAPQYHRCCVTCFGFVERGHLFIVVQHRVKLADCYRDPRSLADDGGNLQAVWNASVETLAVLVSHLASLLGTGAVFCPNRRL